MKAVTTAQRAQELRKFFAPYDPNHPEIGDLNDRIYNDGVLQSIADALMWKLGASRAMVSLVDKDTQYFLAGSTRDEQNNEHNPRFWFGKSSANITEGFCSNTLKTAGNCPIRSIQDLSRDARFKELPIVNGSAATLAFYAGAPILTDRGITIGSLYVVDDQPREAGLSDKQEQCLITSAHRVMRYLEVAREAATRPRLSLMSRGIAKFLETKAQIIQDIAESKSAREASYQAQRERELHSSDRPDLTTRPSLSTPLSNHTDQVERTFQLAAELLKASFNISKGGVAFFDTVTGFDDLVTTSRKTGWTNGPTDGSSTTFPTGNLFKGNITAEPNQQASTIPKKQGRPRTNSDLLCPANITAMVSDEECSPEVLDIKTMESLINRYPDGTVWYFDDEGFFSSSLEQEEVIRNFPTVALAVETLAKEAFAMEKTFSGTRQLIFLPLWDFIAKRWCSACFIWSHSSFPVFTVDCEVAHLSAFTNSVMSEISKLDAIVADQIKGEFIGSMSHEFRSPLHGILASAEFLNDAEHTRSQSLLISTIHNCGRTLLDTVNHLLDYSRLDSLNKELSRNIGTAEEFTPNPLFCVTNIAALCEEVIDGMIMSSGFEDITEPDPQAVAARTMSLMTHFDPLPSRVDQISLPVMLEMENRNWSFYTQPGAIRRVLMNIFGNSIKYTKSGFIRVTLAAEDALPSDQSPDTELVRTVMKLTVQDSGRGMSPEFLQKSLYTPFIQENILAPGVGLGLSIVRNIIDQLGGTIKVQSQVGVGSSVEVRLPFETEPATSPNQIVQTSIDNEYFGAASQIAQEKVIALRRSTVSKIPVLRTSIEESKATTSELIARYLIDWLNFKVIIFDDWTEDIIADVVIVEEHEESKPYMDLLGLPRMPPILVICNLASCVEKGRTKLPDGIAGFISIPVGPRKLATVLLTHFKSLPTTPGPIDMLTRTFQTNLQVKGSNSNLHKGSNLDLNFGNIPRSKLGALDLMGLRSRSASIVHTQAATLSDSQLPVNTPEQPTQLPTPPSSTSSTSTSSPRPALTAAATSANIATLKSISKKKDLASADPISARTPLKVLAVDDNEINLALVRRYLDKRIRDEVDYARNGLEAFEKVKTAELLGQGGYDVIFMDLNMPIMDGFESARRIREFEADSSSGVPLGNEVATSGESDILHHGNGIEGVVVLGEEKNLEKRAHRSYIIALTGLSAERDRKEAVACGIDAFLTKPVRFKNVGKILEERCWVKGVDGRDRDMRYGY